MRAKETVLYYCPQGTKHKNQVKAVLVQMGVRIKNIDQDQIGQTIGYLAGIPGFEKKEEGTENVPIREEVLVMKDFAGSRMDQLFLGLRRAKVPSGALKAIITDSNVNWSFYQLSQELVKERTAIAKADEEKE